MSSMPPRTPRDLTHIVREIEQRLPPKRRKPSLPAISMEGATKGRTMPAVESMAIPERRHVVEVNTNVGAGQDRSRAPQRRAQTLVERQYNSGQFQWEQNATATTVWNLVAEVRGGSEGVSNYSGEHGSGAPWGKGDRKAIAVLRNTKKVKQLADLIYAMAGIPSQDGRKLIDHELAVFIVRACVQTVDAITLAEIGKARSEYGSKDRQEAAGNTVLSEALRKGAGHLGYAIAPEWRDGALRRIIDGTDK